MLNSYFFVRFINLALRVLSMGAKFLLIFLISKYLSVEQLGEYGIFFTTILIMTFVLGYDFYTYGTRQLLKHEDRQIVFIRDQFIFFVLLYVLVLPLLLSLFIYQLVDWKYILYFYLILIFEHLSQELYRLYTTLSKSIFANVLLFVRSGVWVYILAVLWWGQVLDSSLEQVYLFWLVFSFLSILLGVVRLFKNYDMSLLKEKIDWQWIKEGVKISSSFFIGTIAYKVVEFSNRYIIDLYCSKQEVGVFTFFANIANAVQTLVFTLVIMIFYPKLVSAYSKGQLEEFLALKKYFFKEVVVYTVLSCGVIMITITPLLNYIGNQLYIDNVVQLYYLLLAIFFLNLSFVSHYVLYAQEKDAIIRNITLGVAVINVVLNLILIKWMGNIGASISMLISFLMMFLLKQRYVMRL